MNKIDYSKFKFRCSQLGKLMTGINVGLTEKQEETYATYDLRHRGEGKPLTDNMLKDYHELGAKKFGKKVGLSATAMTYLKEIHKENLYQRSKEIGSKYTNKGIQVEEFSISIYSRVHNVLVVKNSERLTNDYLTGETDSCDKVRKLVRDFKSSWDYSTFPFFEDTIPNSDYDWQLEGYMELAGYENGELIYTLVDTPYKIIDDELRRLDWKHDIYNMEGDVRPDSIPLAVETVSNLIYSAKGLQEYCNQSSNIHYGWFDNFKEIPENQRVKVYKVTKSSGRINALYGQLNLCREFLQSLPQPI